MKSLDQSETLRLACEQIAREAKTAAFAVAVRDIETETEFEISGQRAFHAASTIKIAVLLAVFKACDDGRFRLDDPLHVRNHFLSVVDGTPFQLDQQSDGFPQLYRSIGRTEKIGKLADCMITSSSNLATNLLLDFVTVDYAREVLRAANIRGVELRRGVDDERAHEKELNNETTALGLVDLFAALRGEFLSKTSREAAINILLRQRFTAMIPAMLPSHASVAHKTGEISTACHDAGIVYLPERQPYIVAILTEVSAESENRRETVAKISKAIFDAVIGESSASA